MVQRCLGRSRCARNSRRNCRPSDSWVEYPFHAEPADCCFRAAAARARLDPRPPAPPDYRWAEGRGERFTELAAELVRLKVDVIVTSGTPGFSAAKQATSIIPIVFAIAGDPLGTGLVASLALYWVATSPAYRIRRLILLPRDLNICARPSPASPSVSDLGQCRQSQRHAGNRRAPEGGGAPLDIEVIVSGIRQVEEIAPAFEAIEGRADAACIPTGPFVLTNRVRINAMALGARMPTMYSTRDYVELGGLMSYGSNRPEMFSDAPVTLRTRFCAVVNQRHSGRAADQIRSRHQSDDRQGTPSQ